MTTTRVNDQINGTVLIVDDDLAFGEILSIALEEIGLSVEHVSTGTEAIERLTRKKFSLVITDLQMPQLDGLTMLKRLRDARQPLPPVILITANSHWLPETGPEGVVATFAKPVAATQFISFVREAITKHDN